MRIGLICACRSELAPFLSCMETIMETETCMYHFFSGTIGGMPVTAVQCGVCKVNAALAAQLLIGTFHVDAVINSGTAGSMHPSAKIFDIVVSKRIAYHDVEPAMMTDDFPHLKDGYFDADPKLLAAAEATAAKSTNETVLFGTMVSGESFIDQEGREKICSRFLPLSTDMETAGAAHACYINRVPFLAVRAVTDTEQENGLDIYRSNSRLAGEKAAAFTMRMIEKLAE